MKSWFKKLFRIHEHDRKLFLVGRFALIKCRTCGAESFPWEPDSKAVEAARPHHVNDAKEMTAIDRGVAESGQER